MCVESLQSVIECPVPFVNTDSHVNVAQVQKNYAQYEEPRRVLFVGSPIASRQPPGGTSDDSSWRCHPIDCRDNPTGSAREQLFREISPIPGGTRPAAISIARYNHIW